MATNGELSHFRTAAFVAVIVASPLLGCASTIHVETAEAPGVSITGTTFRFLRSGNPTMASANAYAGGNTSVAGGEVTGSTNPARAVNPILENPIVLQQMQHEMERDLTARGYTRQQDGADLGVAYYLGVKNKLHVTDYDYGYPFWGWDWRWGPGWGRYPALEVTEYQVGTLVIDVLNGAGRRLLWRGMGTINVPSNPQDYSKAIAKGVDAIMSKFPGHAA